MLRVPTTALACLLAAPAAAQHVQTSAVAVDPTDPRVVWTCNRDNGSVARVDTRTGAVTEIPVGVHPRTLAVTPDGARVLVANQRGNVPVRRHFLTPFDGSEVRGNVSVIDTAAGAVVATLDDVGVEPYGVALAPGGAWFAVSGFRSGTLAFYETATLARLFVHQLPHDLDRLPAGTTMADVDANRDGIADLGDPRGFTIRADGRRLLVTHHKSPFVSAFDVALDGNGLPTGVALAAKIDTDEYPFDPFFDPTPVREVRSQGLPRFLEDVALSPDGSRALVPHVLHNVNHDVNHAFAVPDPLNRVYPALTVLDADALSYGAPGDLSTRLHHEHADDPTPAEFVPYGESGVTSLGDRLVLGGLGSPRLGGDATFVLSGWRPGDVATLLLGTADANVPVSGGTLLVQARLHLPMTGDRLAFRLPNLPQLDGLVAYAQVMVDVAGGPERRFSNGLVWALDADGREPGSLAHRPGHPSRVLFSPDGDHAVLLNRGSEDVFLFGVDGSELVLRDVYPPRRGFVERAPLDATTPTGDLPLGMALADDPATPNDDALLYVQYEGTRTLATLRLDWTAGTIQVERAMVPTHAGPDAMTLSERIGQELFEDASRAQTAGGFNNSCASCHFEGGEDSNVWQRPTGPRSTMPVYGGSPLTGTMLWKGQRLNMGETGPMFAGENGGTGVLTDAEQQGLIDYHAIVPVPLNPHLDPATGDLTAEAAFGRDLFFGTDSTGLNPTLRHAGCTNCHPKIETGGPFPGPRFFTTDFLPAQLTDVADALETLDPNCVVLGESFLSENLRDVNSAVNVDDDGNMQPDVDRNFDGFDDRETYVPMNADADEEFQRDDANGYLCPCTPGVHPNCDPANPFRRFDRTAQRFSVPTKLGVFATGPYFHDHAPFTLRALLNPKDQALSPIYGSPAFPGRTPYPGLNKLLNGEHDIFGDDTFGATSEVQIDLRSGSERQKQVDFEALLAFVESL